MRTAECHQRVEQRLDLLDAGLTPSRLLVVLARLHGFWSTTEPAIDEWATRHPDAAQRLQWPRRRRLDRLAHDLETLSVAQAPTPPTVEAAPPVFPDIDEAAVFGWLYVAEGSTLGGALIDRALRRAGFARPLTSFVPYAEGPGPMWRDYLARLEQWTAGDAVRADLVVDAGVATFESLERWLEPVGRAVAA